MNWLELWRGWCQSHTLRRMLAKIVGTGSAAAVAGVSGDSQWVGCCMAKAICSLRPRQVAALFGLAHESVDVDVGLSRLRLLLRFRLLCLLLCGSIFGSEGVVNLGRFVGVFHSSVRLIELMFFCDHTTKLRPQPIAAAVILSGSVPW